ncbi:MAG TPA: RluA family pseudouridine synthase [Actinobacteria bacterium]|nr:RluA family pseudouridine synthase [Actinomycetota bacterium]
MVRVSQELNVGDSLEGQRADKAVATLLQVSRAEARRCFDEGTVSRGGHALRPSDRVANGDVLALDVPQRGHRLVPEPIEFGVVFEDEDLAVIDKPTGLVVHPGAGNAAGTLVGGLLHRWPEIEGVGEYPRWGIVHRLDRETSGALLIAKTADAHSALQAAIGAHEVSRKYLALVHGLFPAPTGTIEAPVERDPTQPTRQRVAASGRPATTHYSLRAAWEEPTMTLLDVELETGRTHQIRVHLNSIGRLVVGDPVYGRPGPTGVDPGRVWLHATRLEFSHPLTEVRIEADVPLAPELSASLEGLGAPSSGAI